MSSDDWKDGLGQDGFREYAQYMGALSKELVDAFVEKGFSREEAIRLAIAIIPGGYTSDRT